MLKNTYMIIHIKDKYVCQLTVGLDDGAFVVVDLPLFEVGALDGLDDGELEGADYFKWDKGERC